MRGTASKHNAALLTPKDAMKIMAARSVRFVDASWHMTPTINPNEEFLKEVS